MLLIGLNSIRPCKNVYNNSILVKATYATEENTSFKTRLEKKRKEKQIKFRNKLYIQAHPYAYLTNDITKLSNAMPLFVLRMLNKIEESFSC